MIRATTPTHTFSFEQLDPNTFQVLNIYYAQQGVEKLVKHKEDCVITSDDTNGNTTYYAAVTLTQEETKLFSARYKVEVQLRVLTQDNRALATGKYELPVNDVINDEVLE